MIVETITSITMSIASLIYASKNIKHIQLCFGICSCTSKSDQDEEIKQLQDQLEITIKALKKMKEKTPRYILNNELKESEIIN
jgi:hypothetical protein